MSRYVLITPAHNEEAFIADTIASVLRQTIRPERWVIVNDGSTDRTGEIIRRLAAGHPFIECLHVARSGGRNFGHKARAFGQGWERVRHLEFEFVGNLDADIVLAEDYFEKVLGEFEKDPMLGLAGGMVESRVGERYESQRVSLDSVAGAVQLFRRRCFEAVGGYRELPHGGIDTAAEVMARMQGWRVRTFPEYRVREQRRTGTAKAHPLVGRYQEGRRMQSLGYGFWFFLFRCAYRVTERPWLVGSAAALCGYLRAKLRGEPVVLPGEVVRYLQAEQRAKMKGLLSRSSGVARFSDRLVADSRVAVVGRGGAVSPER
ncbi:MAG: glycosyltransferase family 2 protein [Verrucomicrobiales bacterium]|nr:glycosyltransferase family 2 protein [Verrucomicrobiales bacterium]